MKVTVSEIPEEGVELDVEERLFSEDLNILSPVKAFLRIDRKGSDVLVRGGISGEVELQCSRCLRNFGMTVRSQVDLVYHHETVNRKEESHELAAEELDSEFYRDDELDVDSLLVEQLILNVPMKPLCSPDCKGICPECGADLNASRCNCKTVETDPRMKILETLLKRKE